MGFFYFVGIFVFSSIAILFFPLPLKVRLFFDVLSGKIFGLAGLTSRVKKTFLLGRYVHDEGIELYAFKKNILNQIRKEVSRHRNAAADFVEIIRMVDIKKCNVKVAAGGKDKALMAFFIEATNQIIPQASYFAAKKLNIRQMDVEIIPFEYDSFKIKLDLNFDFFLFKAIRVVVRLVRQRVGGGRSGA